MALFLDLFIYLFLFFFAEAERLTWFCFFLVVRVLFIYILFSLGGATFDPVYFGEGVGRPAKV